jgi:putative hemolysin
MSSAELPCLTFAMQDQPPVRFSYARNDEPLIRRVFIRAIELGTGQRKLRKAYTDWSLFPQGTETIFAAGLRLLGITLDTKGGTLDPTLRNGPLLIIANHPFGVADGLAIGDIATQLRRDVKIMTHSLLCQPPEAAKYLLPVDFGPTRAAKLRSAATRKAAVQWLEDGHCLVIFPAGGVATRPKPLDSKALDLPWHPFTARLAEVAGARILPLYFHGENSTLFHLASHSWYPLRAALFFRETLRQANKTITVSIGDIIHGNTLAHGDGRATVVQHLRALTFAQAGNNTANIADDFYWPGKAKF